MRDQQDDERLLFSHKDFFCTVIYRVAHLCELAQNALLKEYGMTHQQTQLLAYIYARRGRDVFQRDIEEEFCLSSATVTQQLNVLERKGFILRQPCAEDKRTKKLILTDLAKEYHAVFYRTIFNVDDVLCLGFTDVEKALFMSLLQKAYDNIRP